MPRLQSHVNLQSLNTLAVPSTAAHYWRVHSKEQLRRALQTACEKQLEVMVLGGGSNVILPECVTGLVIHVAIGGFDIVDEDQHHVWLRAGAGEVWQDLVEYSLARDYQGLENLSLIPGTVGAAPIQNIGAYGVELDRVFHSLSAVDRQSGETRCFDRDACEFSYRDSVFKNRLKDRYVITEVTFKLNKQANFTLDYAPLHQALAQVPPEQLSARLISEAVCRIRRSKLPDPNQMPNAGSFFKNPILAVEQFRRLQEEHPQLACYPVDEQRIKVAAAWLLDVAGWRGHTEDGVGMHINQALVLVNPGRCSAERILAYSGKIQADIQRRFGVRLEREPVAY